MFEAVPRRRREGLGQFGIEPARRAAQPVRRDRPFRGVESRETTGTPVATVRSRKLPIRQLGSSICRAGSAAETIA